MYLHHQLRAYEEAKLHYLFQSGQLKAKQTALLKESLWNSNPNEALILPYLNNYCDSLLMEGNIGGYKENLLRALHIGNLKMAQAILPHLRFYLNYSKIANPCELSAFINTILVKYPYQNSTEPHITSVVLPHLQDYLNTDEKTRSHRISIIEGSNDPVLIVEMRRVLINFKPISENQNKSTRFYPYPKLRHAPSEIGGSSLEQSLHHF
jgi:hypothetical protein